jgi:hypothetical protein
MSYLPRKISNLVLSQTWVGLNARSSGRQVKRNYAGEAAVSRLCISQIPESKGLTYALPALGGPMARIHRIQRRCGCGEGTECPQSDIVVYTL